jgi:hypothetical protein
MKTKKKHWRAVDSWAFVKGDAESPSTIKACVDGMKQSHPEARVRTFKRTIRAGGACIFAVAIVAQVPREEPEGDAHATR